MSGAERDFEDAMLRFLSKAALNEALQASDPDLERLSADYREAALTVWNRAPVRDEEGRAR
jgi:hypothetical protein